MYEFGSSHCDIEIGGFRVSRTYIHTSHGSNVVGVVHFHVPACRRRVGAFSFCVGAERLWVLLGTVFIKKLLFLVFRAVPEIGLVRSCEVSVVCCAALRVFSFPHFARSIFEHAKGKKLYERAACRGSSSGD